MTTTPTAAADSRGNADLADTTADGATSAPRLPGGACWPRRPTRTAVRARHAPHWV